MRKTLQERGVPEPRHALFRCQEWPEGATPKPFAQFSRIMLDSGDKIEAVKAAWKDVMTAVGKEPWGAKSVEGDEIVGLGMAGWDSLEEAKAAYSKPEVKAAMDKYHALGKCKDVIVEMKMY